MNAAKPQSHWQSVYTIKHDTMVSWFEENPAPSLDLIALVGASRQAAIIDIGGGASRLVDRLIVQGYEDLTVLDVSAAAFTVAKARVGVKAEQVHWLVADVTTWEPSRAYDVWHDRATFHFLTNAADQAAMSPGFVARYGPANTPSSALSRLTALRSAADCRSHGKTPNAWAERLGLGLI